MESRVSAIHNLGKELSYLLVKLQSKLHSADSAIKNRVIDIIEQLIRRFLTTPDDNGNSVDMRVVASEEFNTRITESIELVSELLQGKYGNGLQMITQERLKPDFATAKSADWLADELAEMPSKCPTSGSNI